MLETNRLDIHTYPWYNGRQRMFHLLHFTPGIVASTISLFCMDMVRLIVLSGNPLEERDLAGRQASNSLPSVSLNLLSLRPSRSFSLTPCHLASYSTVSPNTVFPQIDRNSLLAHSPRLHRRLSNHSTITPNTLFVSEHSNTQVPGCSRLHDIVLALSTVAFQTFKGLCVKCRPIIQMVVDPSYLFRELAFRNVVIRVDRGLFLSKAPNAKGR